MSFDDEVNKIMQEVVFNSSARNIISEDSPIDIINQAKYKVLQKDFVGAVELVQQFTDPELQHYHDEALEMANAGDVDGVLSYIEDVEKALQVDDVVKQQATSELDPFADDEEESSEGYTEAAKKFLADIEAVPPYMKELEGGSMTVGNTSINKDHEAVVRKHFGGIQLVKLGKVEDFEDIARKKYVRYHVYGLAGDLRDHYYPLDIRAITDQSYGDSTPLFPSKDELPISENVDGIDEEDLVAFQSDLRDAFNALDNGDPRTAADLVDYFGPGFVSDYVNNQVDSALISGHNAEKMVRRYLNKLSKAIGGTGTEIASSEEGELPEILPSERTLTKKWIGVEVGVPDTYHPATDAPIFRRGPRSGVVVEFKRVGDSDQEEKAPIELMDEID